MIQLMSADAEVLPDSLAGFAASAAIAVSDVPFDGPISEVRVARVNGEFVINPLRSELEEADMDIMVAGTLDSIVMVEGEMQEVSEGERMVDAIEKAHEAIKAQCEAQNELAKKVGTFGNKREYSHETHDEALRSRIQDEMYPKFYEAGKTGATKEERKTRFSELKASFMDSMSAEEKEENGGLGERLHQSRPKESRSRFDLE